MVWSDSDNGPKNLLKIFEGIRQGTLVRFQRFVENSKLQD